MSGGAKVVDPHVVKHVHQLLQMAEAGEINGVVATYSLSDGGAGRMMVGRWSATLIGHMMCMVNMLCSADNNPPGDAPNADC